VWYASSWAATSSKHIEAHRSTRRVNNGKHLNASSVRRRPPSRGQEADTVREAGHRWTVGGPLPAGWALFLLLLLLFPRHAGRLPPLPLLSSSGSGRLSLHHGPDPCRLMSRTTFKALLLQGVRLYRGGGGGLCMCVCVCVDYNDNPSDWASLTPPPTLKPHVHSERWRQQWWTREAGWWTSPSSESHGGHRGHRERIKITKHALVS